MAIGLESRRRSDRDRGRPRSCGTRRRPALRAGDRATKAPRSCPAAPWRPSPGEKTGRSPKDKRIVEGPAQRRRRLVGAGEHPGRATRASWPAAAAPSSSSGAQPRVFVVDGYAGWDPEYRVKVRVICSRAYHALFMHNLLIRPTPEELEHFGEPDFLIINAGDRPADPLIPGVSSHTSVMLHLDRARDGHPGHQLRRRDEEGRLHRDELLDADARRALDALQRQRGRRTGTSASSSGCRARARRRFPPTRGGG